jgi:hypothetical protein
MRCFFLSSLVQLEPYRIVSKLFSFSNEPSVGRRSLAARLAESVTNL